MKIAVDLNVETGRAVLLSTEGLDNAGVAPGQPITQDQFWGLVHRNINEQIDRIRKNTAAPPAGQVAATMKRDDGETK